MSGLNVRTVRSRVPYPPILADERRSRCFVIRLCRCGRIVLRWIVRRKMNRCDKRTSVVATCHLVPKARL